MDAPESTLVEISMKEVLKGSPDVIITAIKKAPTDLYPMWISGVLASPHISFANKRKIATTIMPELEKILQDRATNAQGKINTIKALLIPINLSLALYIFLYPGILHTQKEELLKGIKGLKENRKNTKLKNVILFFESILNTYWSILSPKKLRTEGINLTIPTQVAFIPGRVHSLLLLALSNQRWDPFGFLLLNGAQFIPQELETQSVQESLHTFLMKSIEPGNLYRVRILINVGAAKRSQKLWGQGSISIDQLPLYQAIIQGKMDILRYLLQQNLFDLKDKINFKMYGVEKETLLEFLEAEVTLFETLQKIMYEKSEKKIKNLTKGIEIIKE